MHSAGHREIATKQSTPKNEGIDAGVTMRAEQREKIALEFVLGQLSEDEAASVSAVIETDSELKQTVDSYRQVLAGEKLLSLQRSAASEDFVDRVLDQIEEENLTIELSAGLLRSATEQVIYSLQSCAVVLEDLDYWLNTRGVYRGAAVAFALSLVVFLSWNNGHNATEWLAQMPQSDRLEVLVPNRNIPAGQPLEPQMFSKVKVALPKGKEVEFMPIGWLHDYSQISASFARTTIVAGQPLHSDFIEAPPPIKAMNLEVPEGYRVVTVAAEVPPPLDKDLDGGSIVTIGWRNQYGFSDPSMPVIDRVKLLAVQQMEGRESDQTNFRIVTLLVPVFEAAKLKFAESSGMLSIESAK